MLEPITLLLIDPFVEEGEMYREYFERCGFIVRVYADAEAGCEAAGDSQPDVLVARFRQACGLITGVQITERLKTSPLTQHIPVVIISTSILARDRDASLAAGCDAYVLLPCGLMELVRKTRRLARQVRAARQAQARPHANEE